MKTVPFERVTNNLKLENPWWETGEVSKPVQDMCPRPYLDILYPLVAESSVQRAVILMGPRRVGKTVLINHLIDRLLKDGVSPNAIFYTSIDHPLYNGMGLEDLLESFFSQSGTNYKEEACYVFFDEIQYLRDWEQHLKTIVDRFPRIRCVASGSAAAALRLKSIESGAGRFTDFLLPPLTFYEYLLLIGQDDLVTIHPYKNGLAKFGAADYEQLNAVFLDYLNFGGYPEVALSSEIQSDPARFIKNDIIDKVLLRDLPSLYGIQDVQELNRLFTVLAYNTANEISLEELARNSGVAKNTLKRYIEYLEAAFLIKIVHRVDDNARRFKRANYFKVYLTNPSMRSALFSPIEENDPAMGSLVETAIFSQWFHSSMDLHYARWKTGEVDIINLKADQKVSWAVEAKWSDRYCERPHELKSLLRFCQKQSLTSAMVTTKTVSREIEIEGVELEFYPVALYCFALGYNIISHHHFSKFSEEPEMPSVDEDNPAPVG